MKRSFRIDLFDQSKYRLETKSGMKVVEYVVLKSNVRQPVICVVEDHDGEHETGEFTIDGRYNCTDKETNWDLVMVPIEQEVEQVKMPIHEHSQNDVFFRLYKETGKSVFVIEKALRACNGDYESAYKLLTVA